MLVLSIGVGIAGVTAAGGYVDAVLAPPAGVDDIDAVMHLYHSASGGINSRRFSYPDVVALKSSLASFSAVAGWTYFVVHLEIGPDALRGLAEVVDGDYFMTLQAGCVVGRCVLPADARAGAPPTAVISERMWKRHFEHAPDVVGRQIAVDGHQYSVVGVVEPTYRGLVNNGLTPTDVWIAFVPKEPSTLAVAPSGYLGDSSRRWLSVVARRRAGVSDGNAAAEVASTGRGVGKGRSTETWTARAVRTVTINENVTRVVDAMAGIAMGLMVAVLAIAASNAATLSLARSWRRREELATHLALGATTRRLAVAMMFEVGVVVVAGALVATWLTLWIWSQVAIDIAVGEGMRLLLEPRLSVAASGGGAAATVGVFLVAALWPSLRIARRVGLGAMGATPSLGSQRILRTLVAGQLAVSTTFLGVAALASLQHVHDELSVRDAVEATVVSASINVERFGGAGLVEGREGTLSPAWRAWGVLDGWPGRRERQWLVTAGEMATHVEVVGVTPGALEALGSQATWGRLFDGADTSASSRVAILNEAARRRLGGLAEEGARSLLATDPMQDTQVQLTIVGVVESALGPGTLTDSPQLLVPFSQHRSADVVIAAAARSGRVETERLRGELAQLEGVDVDALRDFEVQREARSPFATTVRSLAGILGSVAFAMTLVGLFGIVSEALAARWRDVAIRRVLGAGSWTVARYVVAQGMQPISAGMSCGALCLVLIVAGLNRMWPGRVTSFDLAVVVVVLAVLAVTALVICLLPVARLVRVPLADALRHD